jgi:uncharacterized protein
VKSERIEFVDALRGYALMGLFLIHMVEYFELYWLHQEPGPVNTIMFALFGGKAYAIFALLFGLSFFIILNRQAQRGVDFRWRFAWRVLLLFVLGTLHGLLYGGDILQVLALAGFVILPFWKASNRAILIVALVFFSQLPTMLYVGVMDALLPGAYAQPYFYELSQAVYKVYAGGSFADLLAANAWQGLKFKWAFTIESGRLSNIIGLALLGCLLGRLDFFHNRMRFRPTYAVGLAVCVCASLLLLWAGEYLAGSLAHWTAAWFANNAISIYTNTLWAGATVLLLLSLYAIPAAAKTFRLLAPPGRMSLTVYVMQSVMCVPLFYGFGLGMHAWIGQAPALALGIVLWIALVAAAHAWMRRFHYGPLEWVWRSLTHTDRTVPIIRHNSATSVAPPNG